VIPGAVEPYSRSRLSISLPLPHTATHPRKPTVLVRDLSTREVAVKWIAHFPYSTVVVGAVAKAERFTCLINRSAG